MIDLTLVDKMSTQLRKSRDTSDVSIQEADVTFYRIPDTYSYDDRGRRHIHRVAVRAIHRPSGIEVTLSCAKDGEEKLPRAAFSALAAMIEVKQRKMRDRT